MTAQLLTTISTVAGAILAQFAPWLQTPAKAAIAAVGAVVVAVYTHEKESTTRATSGHAAEVAKAQATPPPSPTVPVVIPASPIAVGSPAGTTPVSAVAPAPAPTPAPPAPAPVVAPAPAPAPTPAVQDLTPLSSVDPNTR